jgi:putative hemolysin
MQAQFDRPAALSVSRLLSEPLRSLLNPMEPAIQKLFLFDRLWEVFQAARCPGDPAGTVDKLLALLGITWHLEAADLAHIPRTGGVLAVANHPFGLLEGAILAAVLPRIRPDVRILTNSLLAGIPELRERCIFIDPFGHKQAVGGNAAALRDCLTWMAGGGLLVTFPAGEVAHMNFKNRTFSDPPWHASLARVAQRAGAAAVPIFFEGANSVAFQLAGAVHPSLRTASLPRELLNKRGHPVEIRIGRPVAPATLQSFQTPREAIEYLRCRTYLLENGGHAAEQAHRFNPAMIFPRKAPIIAAAPAGEVACEIESLPPARRLAESGDLAVYIGARDEFPTVMREIGRLREIAFRGAGEGTGRSLDLDRFDLHYQHLVLWNGAAREVVGAYRLGPTPDILPRHGIRGLYTSTLFRFRPDLFDRIGPAIELGRSFIRPEYQKQYAPLLLLWKGITRYAGTRPECATLFGGVTISNDYHPVSRHLMVKFLETRCAADLAPLVSPRRPYRPAKHVFQRTGLVSRVPGDMEELSGLIAEMESDGKGVPILVKQYLKTGGRLLAFNVDRGFSNALDALIMVDLRTAPAAMLERFLGKPGAAAFSAWHAAKR